MDEHKVRPYYMGVFPAGAFLPMIVIGYADYGIIPQPHFLQRVLSATKRPMLDSTMIRVPVFDVTLPMPIHWCRGAPLERLSRWSVYPVGQIIACGGTR
jgi:hypothetical protein